jgi:hypothetical protein
MLLLTLKQKVVKLHHPKRKILQRSPQKELHLLRKKKQRLNV